METLLTLGAEPSVDVVIPVYNGAPYIERALRSVLAQDLPPSQIIVIDDGSTDDTAGIVQAVQSSVPIRYTYQPNRGLSSARNAGIRLSKSSYVAFLDADDEWYPHKLSSQLALFRDSVLENLGAVYCRYDVIDEESRLRTDQFIVEPGPANRGYLFDKIIGANRITGSGSGILVRRACFERVGSFDESLTASEDWDMWLRLAEHYQFDFVPEKLVKIRVHSQNMQRDSIRMYHNSLIFYNKWSASAFRFGHHDEWSNAIVCKIAQDLPGLGSFHLTRRLLDREAKGRLFHDARGSLVLFLLFNAPKILIIIAKRLLGQEG